MAYHTACVKRGNEGALILADLPFMAHATPEQAFANCATLMQAGAHMIKLEGAAWLAETIRLLAERGVPVCAHGPDSADRQCARRLQGSGPPGSPGSANACRRHRPEQAGAAMLLLECVPSDLAAEITQAVSIPVIGIGAGSATDGQVLVLHDMLGLSLSGRVPKFVKNFMEGQPDIHSALAAYVQAVKAVSFPGSEHGFSA